MLIVVTFKDVEIYKESIKSIPIEGLKNKDYLKENDILITGTGKSGQVVRISQSFKDYVISSDIIRIRSKRPSTAKGLVSYFKSEAGQYALESIKSGI